MNKENNICPITYIPIDPNKKYSTKGLRKLSPRLKILQDFPYNVEQQIIEARKRANKMSIQGVQPKLSVKLNITNQRFELCDIGGTYIFKPQNRAYDELPENEALTMHLASEIIEVPLHGLIYCTDSKFTYFIKRFDRGAGGNKIPVEDFTQLARVDRDTKYNYSMEKIIPIINKHCTFPAKEKAKLFTRIIFNYLIGNEDMHLKNYSLITRRDIVELAPAYDFINTTIATGSEVKEQIALPLNGKKNNLTKKDLVEYYGLRRLDLSATVINETLNTFSKLMPKWHKIIGASFLSMPAKEKYNLVLDERRRVLGI